MGQWVGGGTHTGPAFDDLPIGSLPANSGGTMHFTGTTVLKVENGRITEEVGLDDGVAVLRQLGLIPGQGVPDEDQPGLPTRHRAGGRGWNRALNGQLPVTHPSRDTDRSHLEAAADRAREVYPGPAGELIHRELADLVPAFALPIPSLVIGELLGVAAEDRARFQRLASRPLDLSLPPHERTVAFRQVRAFMADLVTRPGEGLLDVLARERGDDLTTDELAAIGHLMLLGGYETTAQMLALGTPGPAAPPRTTARHAGPARPPRRRRRRAPALAHRRQHCHTARHHRDRRARRPASSTAGELVLVSLSAANRDPALVADPEVLDLTRRETGHVAFGRGVHHCLGAPLARAELRIALPALLRRFPRLRLADPAAEIPLRPFSIVHGVTALHMAW